MGTVLFIGLCIHLGEKRENRTVPIFKSIKSIVRIRFVEKMPKSAWMKSRPEEYGFYANVNPFVSHPRWSQATERRIGEGGKRKTIIFNGYEAEVGSLYAGMNLKREY